MTKALNLIQALFLVALAGFAAASEESLVLGDGVSLKVLYFAPENTQQAPPLAMLIPGGSSNEFMARAQFWLGKGFVERVWAIAIPISPDGIRFSEHSADVFPRIIEYLHQAHRLRNGKPLLVGISGGGSAALEIALNNPDEFSGVVATPGRVKPESTPKALQGLPVYLRVGEKDDFLWNRTMDPQADMMRAAGAKVDAALVPDARHIFRLDWEGLEVWLKQTR